MRTKTSYIITLITDPGDEKDIAGKLENVKNGECHHFRNWEELKEKILEGLKSNPKHVQAPPAEERWWEHN